MVKFFVNLTLAFLPSVWVFADYFKWEILLSEKRYGSEIQIFPISHEGQIDLKNKKFSCRTENFWTRIESDLLLEGKTLVCYNGEKGREISLICRDNHRNRKYNSHKELYPVSKFGFFLFPELESDSPYLEFRCFF